MKGISGSYHFISLQIRLTALSLRETQVSFLFGASASKCREIYSSIAKDLKFDWSIQAT